MEGRNMVLAIDVGNTLTNLGFYDNSSLVKEFKLKSDSSFTLDQIESTLINLLSPYKESLFDVEGAIISCVVPILEKKWVNVITKLFNVKPLTLGPKLKTGIAIRTDNPKEVGSDLIADCVGAKAKYKLPAIIVDLGTANKIIALDENATFIGCAIGPGLEISKEALVSNAALLPEVDFSIPKSPIGKNTPDSMNSAFTYGNACLVRGMANLFKKELKQEPSLILTGGYSSFIYPLLSEFTYDPSLLLDGLFHLYSKRK
ncbi:MAG: type III pantothenate kinase [Mollicutes bacterium]|nr:type III pantothenate kinase [Mollicutes bacterium]